METWLSINNIAFLLVLPVLICGALAIYSFTSRPVPGSRIFAFLMLAVFIWSAAYAVELSSLTLQAMLICIAFEYIGIVSIPPLWLMLTLTLTGRSRLVNRRTIILLFIIPLSTLLLNVTNQLHFLYYSRVNVDYSGPIPLLAINIGPWYIVFMVFYYICMLTGTVLLLFKLRSPSRLYRLQAMTLLIGVAVPWIVNILYVIFNVKPYGHLDLTPFAFAVTGLVASWGIFRYGLFDVVPIAHELVIQSMNEGLVVLDKQNRIVDCNLAARRFFSWNEVPAGLHLDQACKQSPEMSSILQSNAPRHAEISFEREGTIYYYETNLSELKTRRGKSLGRTLLLHDITNEKRAEKDLWKANESLQQMLSASEKRLNEIVLLGDMAQWIHSSRDMDTAYRGAAMFLGQMFSGNSGFIAAVDYVEKTVTVGATFGHPKGPDKFALHDCLSLRYGKLWEYDGSDNNELCPHLGDYQGYYLSMPLIAPGGSSWLLSLQSDKNKTATALSGKEWLSVNRPLFISAGQELVLALANVQLRENLREQATRDPLTGLYNRRYMEEMLDRELRSSLRTGRGIGFIMGDLDHFKIFNDRYGHEVGDLLLKAVSTLMRGTIRVEDIVCRYGGEEFLIILPSASLNDAYHRALQIHDAVANISFEHEENLIKDVTISLGVSAFPDHGKEADRLISAADAAMYRAKKEGRNRVCLPP